MDPFLAPIERPRGLIMKLVYAMTRRRFGKVLTPLKVHSARLPVAFGSFYGKISSLDKRLTVAPGLALLIRAQVARLNVCLFCMDIGRSFAIKEMMNEAKFDALDEYRTSTLFTDAGGRTFSAKDSPFISAHFAIVRGFVLLRKLHFFPHMFQRSRCLA